MTRPEDLIYTVDEMPPWPRLLVLGIQHAMLRVNLVLIVIVSGGSARAMRPRSAR